MNLIGILLRGVSIFLLVGTNSRAKISSSFAQHEVIEKHRGMRVRGAAHYTQAVRRAMALPIVNQSIGAPCLRSCSAL